MVPVICSIPIILIFVWWLMAKKNLPNKLRKLIIGLCVALVLIELFEIWARFMAPQYVVKEINGTEIYRTWNYEKALEVYYAERKIRNSSNIILFDEDWGNSLWDDIDPKDFYATEEYDNDNLDLDSLVLSIFPDVDSYKKDISRIGTRGDIYSSYSEDEKVRLFTVDCGGSMTSGTCYAIYRKSETDISVKKIAGTEPSEEGGVVVPALFTEIHNVNNGYIACGIFCFSPGDSLYKDTLYLTKDFLNSDLFYFDWTH